MSIPLALFAATIIQLALSNPCNVRVTESGHVCVCNATYCDTVPEVGKIPEGSYKMYSTSKTTPGFSVRTGNLTYVRDPKAHLLKVTSKRLQVIEGFGGAFTDSATLTIQTLSEAAQANLLDSYFGDSGIEYSLCRVPIGGTDFSPKPYSYDDVPGDVELKYFALQEEDLNQKIPIIREALYRRNGKPLQLFASAWTAPPWMKTNDTWVGYSFLKEENFQVFANYHLRFFEEYAKYGIYFWGVTTGNEASNGYSMDTHSKINAMAWLPWVQARWIGQNLGPTLRNSSITKDLKIIIHDDNRLSFAYIPTLIVEDPIAKEFVDCVGVHWYLDYNVHQNVLDLIDYKAKNMCLLMTEACYFRELGGVDPGSWSRGAGYVWSILEYLKHGSAGWIDWNMALTISGGPTYIGYPADSPIIVNADEDEFYKQPMFYAMGHFSKFIVNGAVKLHTKIDLPEIVVVVAAFVRPDKSRAVFIYNNSEKEVVIQIDDSGVYSKPIAIEANSFNTVLYNLPKTYDQNHKVAAYRVLSNLKYA